MQQDIDQKNKLKEQQANYFKDLKQPTKGKENEINNTEFL